MAEDWTEDTFNALKVWLPKNVKAIIAFRVLSQHPTATTPGELLPKGKEQKYLQKKKKDIE